MAHVLGCSSAVLLHRSCDLLPGASEQAACARGAWCACVLRQGTARSALVLNGLAAFCPAADFMQDGEGVEDGPRQLIRDTQYKGPDGEVVPVESLAKALEWVPQIRIPIRRTPVMQQTLGWPKCALRFA